MLQNCMFWLWWLLAENQQLQDMGLILVIQVDFQYPWPLPVWSHSRLLAHVFWNTWSMPSHDRPMFGGVTLPKTCGELPPKKTCGRPVSGKNIVLRWPGMSRPGSASDWKREGRNTANHLEISPSHHHFFGGISTIPKRELFMAARVTHIIQLLIIGHCQRHASVGKAILEWNGGTVIVSAWYMSWPADLISRNGNSICSPYIIETFVFPWDDRSKSFHKRWKVSSLQVGAWVLVSETKVNASSSHNIPQHTDHHIFPHLPGDL
jgi:hypothetical protein